MVYVDRAHNPLGAESTVNAVSPNALDPTYGGLEIMGQIAYYHILLNRLPNSSPSDGEEAWILNQLNSIKAFISGLSGAGLNKTMTAVLEQAKTNVNGQHDAASITAFNTWWNGTLQNMGGPGGPDALTYLETVAGNGTLSFSGDAPVPPAPGAGQDLPDDMKLPFGIEMLAIDLDHSGFNVDSFFSPRDPHHPLRPPIFSTAGVSVIASYLFDQFGPESADNDYLNWFGRCIDPNHLPGDPSAPNAYNKIFFPAFQQEAAAVDNEGLTQAEINANYDAFVAGFNKEFKY